MSLLSASYAMPGALGLFRNSKVNVFFHWFEKQGELFATAGASTTMHLPPPKPHLRPF
jgi:hypothetical protein